MWKKLTSVFMSVVLAAGLCPGLAFAEGGVQAASADLTTQGGETPSAIDSVRAAIQALNVDPSSYKEEDKERIEAIQADFNSLSAEDQATLDAECSHSDTGQPLGRVLETALWAVWSYRAVDDSTTLADGVYSASTELALSSKYSKGKSTSSRQKAWSVKEVEVKDGHATATLMVESKTYTDIWMGGKTYPRTNSGSTCEFAGVPIDLNSTFYFAGVSSSMSTPIAFSLTTEIEEPAASSVDEPVELGITNNTGMFKAVSASAVANADGSATLTFALSSTGYEWLYMGTYEEALAANAAIKEGISNGTSSDKLIKGSANAAGKLEFQMVIPADRLGEEVAVVAISKSYYEKFLKGQNAQERSYYPRQFNLNLDEKTLVTGDYDMTYDFALTNDVADFKAANSVSAHIVGGPNSNNYKVELTFAMQDATYDKVAFPSTCDPKEAALVDGKFVISMVNQPNSAVFEDKTPVDLVFHVAENAPFADAGADVVRTVTFDQVARTISVTGDPLTRLHASKFEYDGDSVSFVKKDGSNFGMYAAQEGTSVAVEGDNVVITYKPKNKTTYPSFYLGGDIADNGTWDESAHYFMEDGSYSITLPKSYCGYAWPVAVVKADGKTTTSAQYYLAIPAIDMSNAVVTPAWTSKAFNGKVQKPAVKVELDGKELSADDYEVEYSAPNSKNAGSYTVSVIGKGGYKGKTEAATYKITKASIAGKAVALSWTKKAYNGKVQKPTVAKVNGKALKLNTDYTVKYSNAKSTKVGTYKVTVTGKGNYAGTAKVVTYQIAKANPMTVKALNPSVKFNKVKAQNIAAAKAFQVAKAQGKVTYQKVSGDKQITVAKNGVVTVAKGAKRGKHAVKVSVTAAGNANYAAKTVSVTLTVVVK